MLDKNPDQKMIEVMKCLDQNTLCSLMCEEPFVKASFLSKLVEHIDMPIIYLDFDLLYSGYVNVDMLPKKNNVSLFSPDKNDLNLTLKEVLLKISSEKSLVVIDSLNGLYNLFDEKEAGRVINAYIMLLTFVANESNSKILFASMTRNKDLEEWVLSPTSRRVIDAKLMTKLYLKQNNSGLILDVLGKNDSVVSSILLN